MAVTRLIPPANEPLTLDDIKDHLRIDHEHEDALLMQLQAAARHTVERSIDQALLEQTWRQYEPGLGSDRCVRLRIRPVLSVSAVTAFDGDGNPAVLASTDYHLVRDRDGQLVEFADNIDPALCANGLEIDVLCGMGSLGLDVPETLRHAILLLIAHWYEFRGAVAPQDQPVSLPPGFETLIAPWRRPSL